MPTSFFDKIKLFKRAEIQPGHPAADPVEEEKKLSLGPRLLGSPWLFLGVTAVIIALFLTSLPSRSLSTLAQGAVAPADITAPFDLIIEDTEATGRKKEEAVAAILAVYTFDANVFANTEDKIRRLFTQGRDWTLRFPGNHRSEELRTALLDLQGGERTVRVGDLLDIGESERRFADDLGRIEIPSKSRALLANLGQIFLTANVTYNKIEMEKRKARARG